MQKGIFFDSSGILKLLKTEKQNSSFKVMCTASMPKWSSIILGVKSIRIRLCHYKLEDWKDSEPNRASAANGS